ncbi:tetratricopeptide repeat protein [Opitutaceae bacterium LMO-CP1]|nr:tetratricopeptide repeat protein [Opitutaceae bacterium LMO-M01]
MNRNREALNLLLAEATATDEWEAPQVERIAALARAAGEPQVALPIVSAFAAANPEMLAAWRLLGALQRENGRSEAARETQQRVVELTDRDADELRTFAQLLEGTGRPGEAFDVWWELGMKGDRHALDRLVALNPGLYRDHDLLQVLDRMVPVAGHDEYTLLQARFLTEVGRYGEAVEAYRQFLEAEPEAVASWLELARLEVELYRYADAAEHIERVEALGADSVEIRRQLADVWVALGDYEKALPLYRAVAETSGEMDDYGAYFRLARGLGAYEDYVAGLRGVVESAEATASDHVTLAYGYNLLGQPEEAREVLRAGMQRFPEDSEIRLRLAYAFSDVKRYHDAQLVTEGYPGLGSNVEMVRLHLLMMRLNNDLEAERAFLRRELTEAVRADPEVRQALSRAHLAAGQNLEAEQLLRGLAAEFPDDWDILGDLILVMQRLNHNEEAQALLAPHLAADDPRAFKLAADVAAALGEYAKAEQYQIRYLSLVSPAEPTSWGALGDIRLARGDRTGAKRAYQRALRELQFQLLEAEEDSR